MKFKALAEGCCKDHFAVLILCAMYAGLNITEADWQQTPSAVRNVLQSLSHQLRLLRIRCAACEQRVKELGTKFAGIAQVAALTERIRQNSRNSSKPPSTCCRDML
jgi:hypothetical protein